MNDYEDIYHSSHCLTENNCGDAEYYPVSKLYKKLRSKRALVIPHVGGRYANLKFHDSRLEPLIEICSAWGHFEWFLRDAIRRGYIVGFVGGSDDHIGRPGAAYPGRRFAVRGGLTCVYARDLTRESIWDALFKRRCYATTGPRIIVEFFCDGHWMGERYTIESPHIQATIVGSSEIEKVELFRDLKTIHCWNYYRKHTASITIRFVWGGSRTRGRDRTAIWDGSLELKNGEIIEARGYAFDSPNERITFCNDEKVEWRSSTSGDEDGIIITIIPKRGAKLNFNTEPASFSLELKGLKRQRTIHAEGLDLKIVIERLSTSTLKKDMMLDYVDNDVRRGLNTYYVRVTQADGNKAWSSPIYVNYKPNS